MLLNLLLLLLRKVDDWCSITVVVEFMGLFIPDVSISLQVEHLLFCPLISKICLVLFSFMMYNCPAFLSIAIDNIDSELVIFFLYIFILQSPAKEVAAA